MARVECETMGSGRLGVASRWLGYGFKVGKRMGVFLGFLGLQCGVMMRALVRGHVGSG